MTQTKKKELIIGSILKILAIAASLYGMFRSMSGLMFLTYFTNLSNIFVDVVLGYFLAKDLASLFQKRERKHSNIAYRVKFLATISITLTFLVFMLILAPNLHGGFWNAYFGNGSGSYGVHFLNPLLAIIDFCLFDYKFASNNKDAFFGVIPPLVYVAFILLLSALGVRWGKGMYAPYNFLNFGAKTGWFGFDLSTMGAESFGVGVFYMIVVLVLIFIGLGKLFLLVKDLRKKNH